MQKALRINLVKRNQTIRKNRKNLFKTRRSQEKDYDEWAVANSRLTNSQIKEERKNRREDWILGPLAPDRDTGLKKGALGTIDVMQAQARAPPKHLVGGPIPGRNWEGEGNIGNIVVGDRVVAVKGPSRGQIGAVKELDKAKAQVVVGDVNTVGVDDSTGNAS
jgi:large subunit ribosomal protein L24